MRIFSWISRQIATLYPGCFALVMATGIISNGLFFEDHHGWSNALFAFELTYSGVFRVQNLPQDQMHPVIMIECPRLLFPFAREIVATAVRNGGFPPLLLDPVDFVALYQQRAAQAQVPQPASTQS